MHIRAAAAVGKSQTSTACCACLERRHFTVIVPGTSAISCHQREFTAVRTCARIKNRQICQPVPYTGHPCTEHSLECPRRQANTSQPGHYSFPLWELLLSPQCNHRCTGSYIPTHKLILRLAIIYIPDSKCHCSRLTCHDAHACSDIVKASLGQLDITVSPSHLAVCHGSAPLTPLWANHKGFNLLQREHLGLDDHKVDDGPRQRSHCRKA